METEKLSSWGQGFPRLLSGSLKNRRHLPGGQYLFRTGGLDCAFSSWIARGLASHVCNFALAPSSVKRVLAREQWGPSFPSFGAINKHSVELSPLLGPLATFADWQIKCKKKTSPQKQGSIEASRTNPTRCSRVLEPVHMASQELIVSIQKLASCLLIHHYLKFSPGGSFFTREISRYYKSGLPPNPSTASLPTFQQNVSHWGCQGSRFACKLPGHIVPGSNLSSANWVALGKLLNSFESISSGVYNTYALNAYCAPGIVLSIYTYEFINSSQPLKKKPLLFPFYR
jgi:hypothetical protein